MSALKSEGAVGVVSKGALTLDDAKLKITIRKPVKELPIDTKRVLVKGLSDKTTRDGSAAVTFGETYGKFQLIKFISIKNI